MAAPVSMIVGLGNPGPEYSQTRHNAGVWFVEELARHFNISLSLDNKFYGHVGRGNINGHDVRLLIPNTFMNRSGQATSALANFYKIPLENILVAHDELDMPPGVAKLKRGGGHGGHNGLRDIIAKHGNQKDFLRLRIGIDHPGHKDRVTGHVLGKAPSKEQDAILAVIDEAVRVTADVVDGQLEQAMQTLHRFKA